LIQQHVTRRVLSRVTALHYGTWTVVAPLGLALVGAVGTALGPRTTLLGAAAAAVLSNGLPLALRDVRRLGWRDARVERGTAPARVETAP
jgi:hypothetical protein